MRLEDMSFADYLMAECEWREKQRKKKGYCAIGYPDEWGRYDCGADFQCSDCPSWKDEKGGKE